MNYMPYENSIPSNNNSPIIIEIIPTFAPFNALLYLNTMDTKFNLIRIDENQKQYFHIYFNDLTEEVGRNYFTNYDRTGVKKVKVVFDPQVTSLSNLFAGSKCIESVNFKNKCGSNITKIDGMFDGCTSLREVNFSNFNTSNVIDMSKLFAGCTILQHINFSNFNTNKVTDMKSMFADCHTLKELDL